MDDASQRAHQAWIHAERIRRLSDRVVSLGPLGLGLDGVLAWIPGANVAYAVGAGGLLLYCAVQAGAGPATLARMGIYLAADSALSSVPVAGWAVDTFFPGHLLAAKALQRDIEKRHGKPAQDLPKGWGRWSPSFGRGRMRNVTPGA
ncbi:DUF4112 domain-containing protein [Phenylobacterium sp. LjRoot219]|uniref:DUF4112 domain-containing protein n=1 Tax=Phenylobacterium sp. LjRoot219 TaxID=3342283 RepID=UPI003ED07E58